MHDAHRENLTGVSARFQRYRKALTNRPQAAVLLRGQLASSSGVSSIQVPCRQSGKRAFMLQTASLPLTQVNVRSSDFVAVVMNFCLNRHCHFPAG